MKKHYVADLKPGDEFADYFLVKSSDIRVGGNGKKYLDITLADASAEISGKKWDIDDGELPKLEAIHGGITVAVKADVKEWKGSNQLRIMKIRETNVGDVFDLRDLVKAAPEPSEEMYDYITGTIRNFQDEELKKICLGLYEENKEKLMYYPAAASNHHAEYGGLLYHVKRMMMMGERACQVYTNLSKDLLLAGVAIHDIEKLTEIISDENGVSPGYSMEGNMLGHIVQGVSLIHDRCAELGIGAEKTIMLEHMILSHHYEPEFGSPKKPLFPEAEMLHYLDMIDAKMYDMEDSLRGVEPGEFGPKVWTLDNRRIYKRTF